MRMRRRRPAAFAALFAVLLGAFAPTVTHFLAAWAVEPAVAQAQGDVCTYRTQSPGAPSQSKRDSCPFCVNPAVAHAPPVVGDFFAVYVAVSYRVAAPTATRLVDRVLWLSALSRGPPFLS
jgi:hypothetical protein